MTKAREIAELGQKLTVDGSGNLDIAGTIEANNIQVEGASGSLINVYRASANANFDAITFKDTTNTNINGKIGWNANELRLEGTNTIRLLSGGNASAIFGSNGDTTLYRDDGSTIHTVFDASNGFTDHRGTLKISSNQNDPNDSTAAYITNKSGWGPTVHGFRFRVNAGATGSHTNVFAVGTSMGAVFNEDSQDHDFRVESDTRTHAIFVDASGDKVGLMDSSPDGNYPVTIGGRGDKQLLLRSTGDSGYTQGAMVIASGTTDNPGNRGQGVYSFNEGNDHTYYMGSSYGHGTSQAWIVGHGTGTNFTAAAADKANAVFNIYPTSTGSGTVFNENSFDRDFRIESDNHTHFVFLDATQNTLGVGELTSYAAGVRFHVAKSDASAYGTNGTSIQNDVPVKIQNTNTTNNNIMSGIHIRSGTWDGGIIGVPTNNGVDNKGFLALIAEAEEGARFYSSGGEGGTVINEHGVDRDFRVESDGDSNAIFLDAGANRLNIFGSAGTSKVDIVTGNGAAGDSVNGVSIKASDSNLTEKLNLGVNSTSSYAFINAVKPGTNNIPLHIQPLGAGVIFNDGGNANGDFRVESDNETHALFVEAGEDRVGINHANPSYTLHVGDQNAENMGIGWMRMELFTVGIPSSGTRWYKIANYSTGIMLQGQLFMSAARNGGANQTNGARIQHGSLAGYNNAVNTSDWGDLGTNYGHTAYYVEVGTDTHVYLRVNGSVYGGEVYCMFQGRANWQFDGTYVTSAP